MPWNSTWPIGGISVKANRTQGQQNTTYIENTMGNSPLGTNSVTTRDHFWNVGANEDGRHRFIQSPAFTVGGNPTDAVLGTGMDTVLYPKTILGTVQYFLRNAQGIYQATPAFLSGSVAVPSSGSYSNVVAVPANCYGEIMMYTTALGRYSSCVAHFRSNGSVVEAWTLSQADDDVANNVPLKFANGSNAVDLNLKARRSDAGSATWNYRLTYRAL